MRASVSQLQQAPPIDARYLRVEVPAHPGVLFQVTGIKLSIGAPAGAKRNEPKAYFEALCRYCNKYHYVRVEEGMIAALPPLAWNE